MLKFHELVKQGKMKPEVAAEFDAASKGMKLPLRAPKKPEIRSIQQIREIAKKKGV